MNKVKEQVQSHSRLTVLAIYQGQSPGDTGQREAIAFLDESTIMGYQIAHLSNGVKIGTSSFGQNEPSFLVEKKAEERVGGVYRTAIEPRSGRWDLTIYGPPVGPLAVRTVEDPNEGLIEGRKILKHLCNGGRIDDAGFFIDDAGNQIIEG